ncbi:MAG: PNGase F N-terminal domain-containing protein [Candidatus Eisenbacteria bacterium]
MHNPAESDSGAVFHYSKGTVAVRRVTLPEVDDETMILAELVEVSNGDAYDRTGSIFLIPTDRTHTYLDGLRDGVEALPALDLQNGAYQGIAATEDYLPPLELIRFITPFGVGAFNSRSKVRGLEWADEARYVMDVTDLAGSLQGSVWIGAFIGNYDKGGHKVTLRLRYFPGEQVESETPPARRFTLPLFNTVNAMEMSGQNYGTLFGSDSLSAEFDLPNGIEDLQLRYITTGHGGWGGGDEFNPKVNTILLDGQVASSFVPWRSDCGTFRENNPSSGNFWNGISSSDFSRSGWCPGTTVSPYVVPLAGLVPGRHRIQVAIPLGEREGSAFSSWNVSGVLVGRFADPEQP